MRRAKRDNIRSSFLATVVRFAVEAVHHVNVYQGETWEAVIVRSGGSGFLDLVILMDDEERVHTLETGGRVDWPTVFQDALTNGLHILDPVIRPRIHT